MEKYDLTNIVDTCCEIYPYIKDENVKFILLELLTNYNLTKIGESFKLFDQVGTFRYNFDIDDIFHPLVELEDMEFEYYNENFEFNNIKAHTKISVLLYDIIVGILESMNCVELHVEKIGFFLNDNVSSDILDEYKVHFIKLDQTLIKDACNNILKEI